MVTYKIEWAYNPVKFLNSLENKEHIYKNGNIDVANKFTTYDRLLFIRNYNKYVYISNTYGLQLIDKGSLLKFMNLNENNFTINENVIIDN